MDLKVDNHNVDNAILSLQSPSSNIDERILALRLLKQYLESNHLLDPYSRKRINQVILDNALRIMLQEKDGINPFRRQLIRVELYTILSHILRSESLFGTAITDKVTELLQKVANNGIAAVTESYIETRHNISMLTTSTSSVSLSRTSEIERVWKSGLNSSSSLSNLRPTLKKSSAPIFPRRNKRPIIQTPMSSDDMGENTYMAANSVSLDSIAAETMPSMSREKALVLEVLSKKRARRIEIGSKLKPRPAVLFNDKLAKDNFVPGTDPNNFFEQDRKLGYQKPRMWFPTAMANVNPEGLESSKNAYNSNDVVQDYLKMRALATYIGDSILPYSASILNKRGIDNGSTTSFISSASGVDSQRYTQVFKEVMEMWTPILASHKPQFGMRQSFTHFNSLQQDSIDLPRREAITHEEYVGFGEDINSVDHSTSSPKGKTGSKYLDDLEVKKYRTMESISRLSNKIDSFISSQHQKFQPKYLVLLEGNQARSRRLLLKLTKIYTQVKRRNSIGLAFGIWKICNIESKSYELRKVYAVKASANLLFEFFHRATKKAKKRAMMRWCYTIAHMIFAKRMRAAALIQNMYRRARERIRMVSAHKLRPYNGLLSDITLGPFRPHIRFTIPKIIRTERRMYALAAKLIQTRFRCWFESKDYIKRKKQLILLQSIFRMWPVLCWFRRLKAMTIKCQAWARRTVNCNHYKRLRRATIIVQKYVRRYLAILHKLHTLDLIWTEQENRKYASIVIQCRIRIMKARRLIKAKKLYKKMIQWGALMIQRNWYRKKRAFHTFFLMCALRQRGEEDVALEKLATVMGRNQCARRIERRYKLRFWNRVVSNVIKVQCWYRGRLGYNLVQLLRKQRWAVRKLHFWAKGMVSRRHKMARKIQRWWWLQKKMRILRHLWHCQKLKDLKNYRRLAELRHFAATRIQAHVKGIWDRRWAKRHRAAIKIQRNWRFFHGLKKWKRWKRDNIRNSVQKYVNRVIEKGLSSKVKYLVKKHIEMLVKPQALIRGFIVRSILFKATLYASKLGVAAIKIQRFWRKAGAVGAAVQDVLARKRMESNPYRKSKCIHEILTLSRLQCKKLFNSVDPRVGMKVPDFLYRIGCVELIEIFPRREFSLVTSLVDITIDKLTELYVISQNKKKPPSRGGDDRKLKRGPALPISAFQGLMSYTDIPLYPKKKHDILHLKAILAFPEYATPHEAIEIIRKAFVKKFGKHLHSRAQNIAQELVETAWCDYNSYKSFGKVISQAQILKVIATVDESSQVLSAIEQLRTSNLPWEEIRKWDVDRLKSYCENSQLAIDKSASLLPEGMLYDKVETVANKVAVYQRKSDYLIKKLKALKARKLNANNKSKSKDPEVHKDTSEMPVGRKPIPEANMNHRLTPLLAMEIPYHGPEEEFELEHYACVAKAYSAVIDHLYDLTSSIQSVKNAWSNKALRRGVAIQRRKVFVEKVTQDYIQEQQTDHVKILWRKLRKKEIADKKVELIIRSIREKKAQIESILYYVPRYDVSVYYDENGYEYYVDSQGNSSYEPFIYTFHQYRMVLRIQKLARHYLESLDERKMRRQEEAMQELERIAFEMEEERKRKLRSVEVLVNIKDQGEIRVVKPIKKDKSRTFEDEIQEFLPWKFRFDSSIELFSGLWALLYTPPSSGHTKTPSMVTTRQGSYEVVVIFKVRPKDGLCDVRNVKGTIIRDVSIRRLRHMNYFVGQQVECRYKYRKLFYRGKVQRIDEYSTWDRSYYSVLYDDGEIETNLRRDALRPSAKSVADWLQEREKHVVAAFQLKARQEYYRSMRLERFKGYKKVLKSWKKKSLGADTEASAVSTTTAAEADEHSVPAVFCTKVRLRTSKPVLLFHWRIISSSDSGNNIYYNPVTDEEADDDYPPFYEPIHIVAAQKLQLCWLMHKSRRVLLRKLGSINLLRMTEQIVNKGKQIAFVGYGLEGLTTMQLLLRAGYHELMETIQDYYKAANKKLSTLTIDYLISLDKEAYEKVGILQLTHVRDFRDFQNWWKKTLPHERESKLALFNSYTSPEDSRTMQQCIRGSVDLLFKKFSRIAKSNATKTKSACEQLLEETSFPLAHLQVETYLKRFLDKPEAARDAISDLINKPTTQTWQEERKVYELFKHISIRISATLALYKLKKFREGVQNAIKKAEVIAASDTKVYKSSRPNASGSEAKAAWLLRKDVLQLVIKLSNSAITIQRTVRGFFLARKYKILSDARKRCILILQRVGRRYLAYKIARFTRAQRSAAWEQLWDSNYNAMYYFNYYTGESEYEPPDDGIFRPLVRDRRSDALIQAWPDIDIQRALDASAQGQGVAGSLLQNLPTNLLCSVCNTRKCVKFCLDCHVPNSAPGRPVPYCMLCFARGHPEDNAESAEHRSKVIDLGEELEEESVPYLKCCLCEEPATRKCLGQFSDGQIDIICRDLRRVGPKEWMAVLQSHNIAAERKLVLIVEQLMADQDTENFTSMSPVQVQSIRGFLERTRAECDETYCTACYAQVHTGGRRAMHFWKGFQSKAAVCLVCQSSPAEERCFDCDGNYCDPCFKVFHNKGNKRRHKHGVLKEEIRPDTASSPVPGIDGENSERALSPLSKTDRFSSRKLVASTKKVRPTTGYCDSCERRAGKKCSREVCNAILCDECFEFRHKNTTCQQVRLDGIAAMKAKQQEEEKLQLQQQIKDKQKNKSNGPDLVQEPCVVCGEPADKKCINCGDFYCSRTWMGNPGCFIQFHSKGKRASHRTEPLESPETAKDKSAANSKLLLR